MTRSSVLVGAGAAVAANVLLKQALLVKFRRDVTRLNAGDHAPLLASYADDAVLHFNTGEHRWSGDHVGKPAIDRFLRDFTRARVQGDIKGVWLSGPPWALTMAVRFDDGAKGPSGEQLYENQTCLVLRTRWGKIVDQVDYYVDTKRIVGLEKRLNELGVEPVGAVPPTA